MQTTPNSTIGDLTRTLRAGSKRAPMRALVQSGYGSTDVLRVGSLACPRAEEGEVLVQVQAAGLDRGTWHLMTGRPYMMRLMGFGFSAPKCPVPGLDVAGTVVEVGPKVTRFRVGDAVFGIAQGSFAECARAREDKLALKPSSVSFEQAAVLSVSGSTALQSLRDVGNLQAGERVLIIGASGGVGTFAVQLAKHFGARVTGVCCTSKVELVRGLGADRVIDYTQRDFADGTESYDLILDIGGNTPLARLRRALTATGRLVFVGSENTSNWSGGFGRPLWAMTIAPFVRQRFSMLMAREHHSYFEQLGALVESGALTAAIDRRIGLDGVAEALRDLEAGKVRGKVVVSVM